MTASSSQGAVSHLSGADDGDFWSEVVAAASDEQDAPGAVEVDADKDEKEDLGYTFSSSHAFPSKVG